MMEIMSSTGSAAQLNGGGYSRPATVSLPVPRSKMNPYNPMEYLFATVRPVLNYYGCNHRF